MSNSKLTKYQKQERKELMAVKPNVQLFSFPDYGVVIALAMTGATMGEFTASVASEEEIRFRRKVGEFHALTRFYDGRTVPVYVGSSSQESQKAVAEWIAEAVGDSARPDGFVKQKNANYD